MICIIYTYTGALPLAPCTYPVVMATVGAPLTYKHLALRCGKTGIKKHAACSATLLPNELNSDVGRFTTLIKPALQ